MPETVEVVCERQGCELDMFEVHYTYDVPDDHGVSELVCPYCADGSQLAEIQL